MNIQNQINAKIEKNSGLKKFIDQILLQVKNKKVKKTAKKTDDKKDAEKKIKKISVDTFTAAAYPAIFNYFFRNSFIFDSEVILYIYNRRSRFQDFKQIINK